MTFLKKLSYFIMALVFIGSTGWVLVNFWSQIFSRSVEGRLDGLERVDPHAAVLARTTGNGQERDKIFFSFAIAVRTASGEIVTASSEDRQWAVAKVGQCVVTRIFPYPPWDLEKAGTFFGARLQRLSDCSVANGPKENSGSVGSEVTPNSEGN